MRGDQTFLVYGNRRVDFADVLPARQQRVGHPAGQLRVRPRRPAGRALGQQPRVVRELLGHRQPRRHPRRPQRMVEDRRDRLRPAGLGRTLPRRRRRTVPSHRRRTSTSCPTSRRCSSSTPTPPTSAATRGCAASTSSPPDVEPAFPDVPIDEGDYAVIFYTSGTTGRPKGAISSHRNMIANLQNTMYTTIAGSMVSGDSAAVDASGGRPRPC